MRRTMRASVLGLSAAVAMAGTVGAAAPAGSWRIVCETELDRPVLPAGQASRTVVTVTVSAPERPSGVERPPVNLCVVIDRSGSMQGARIEQARLAAVEALARLDERDRFSLVVYSDQAETLVPPQAVTARNRTQIEQAIRSIRASGFTALYAGVAQGASEIRKHQGKEFVNRIILLSDGLANRGPSTPEELGRLGTALAKEFISVSTVGLGSGYNEDLMTRLAERSDGIAYFAAHSEQLPKIFASELGDVLNVAARDVRVIIEVPEGVRPIRVIGREGIIRGNTIEVYLNQIYSGLDKAALVEVEAPAGRPAQTIDLAAARVTYEDVVSNRRGEVASQVQARYSDSVQEVVENINRPAALIVTRNIAAEAKDAAVDLSDQGRRAEAGQVLRAQSVQMRQLAVDLDQADLLQDAEDLEAAAGQIEQEGLGVDQRKRMRTDSYNYRFQNR